MPLPSYPPPADFSLHFTNNINNPLNTRWFKYDRDKLWLVYTQSVPVIFELPCISRFPTLLWLTISSFQVFLSPVLKISCRRLAHKSATNRQHELRSSVNSLSWNKDRTFRAWTDQNVIISNAQPLATILPRYTLYNSAKFLTLRSCLRFVTDFVFLFLKVFLLCFTEASSISNYIFSTVSECKVLLSSESWTHWQRRQYLDIKYSEHNKLV
jgi:hypothetical protein